MEVHSNGEKFIHPMLSFPIIPRIPDQLTRPGLTPYHVGFKSAAY
jgi:hypothetical protein